MSEYEEVVVRLDAVGDQVGGVAATVIAWLLEHEVIAPNSRPSDPLRSSDWMPGARWTDAVQDPNHGYARGPFRTLVHNGVDVVIERRWYTAGQNFENPSCRRCGCRDPYGNDETYGRMLDEWMNGDEPNVACPGCGWTGAMGEFEGPFGSAVGAPGVVFKNWPELSEGFVQRLRQEMGGRTTVLKCHF